MHLDIESVTGEGAEEPLDELLTEANCQGLVEAAREHGTYREPYPMADRKAGKKYKANLTRMIEQLLEKASLIQPAWYRTRPVVSIEPSRYRTTALFVYALLRRLASPVPR